MPAPTALQRAPEALAEETAEAIDTTTSVTSIPDEELLNTNGLTQAQDTFYLQQNEESMDIEDDATEANALFSPEKASKSPRSREERKVRIPPHRMTPLKNDWPKIYPPLVEHLKLQVRMNVAKKVVELRTSKLTTNPDAIQKGADFLTAYTLGFDLDDAIALLRLDDLYIQSFEVKDVKQLNGEHLSRAVGRIAGKDGKTKFAIENASRTRIVLADSRVHILGGFKNIGVAREAVVSLILGSPPGKVYGNLRTVGARMKERF
jgi:RNA-binding protein PNO1